MTSEPRAGGTSIALPQSVSARCIVYFERVTFRSLQPEQERLNEIRRYEERKLQWNHACEVAVKKLNEARRAALLRKQVEDLELTQRITSYLEAVEDHLSFHPGQFQLAQEWLDWIRGYVERLNPLSSDLCMPADPKPTAALQRL